MVHLLSDYRKLTSDGSLQFFRLSPEKFGQGPNLEIDEDVQTFTWAGDFAPHRNRRIRTL